MPAGQTFRLQRHNWAQQRQFDPNLLALESTDITALDTVPENPGNGYLQRWRGRVWNQWPVLSRDVNPLQSTDQDVTLVPVPQPATYQRYRGQVRNQWPIYSRDVNQLQSTDIASPDLAPEYVPWIRPRDARAQWKQYRPTDLTLINPPDQDVNLLPWKQTPAAYLRYNGRPIFGQWPVLSRLDATGLELPDISALDTVPEFVPWWRAREHRAQWKQLVQYDPNEFAGTLPDQDVNLVPWEQTPAAYLRYGGDQQHKQGSRSDPLVPLPDQLIDLVPWTETPAVYLRHRGTQRLQWPVFGRLDTSYTTTLPDQPDIDLIPWEQTTAAYLRYRGTQHRQWPVYSRLDATGLELADQDVRLVPLWAAGTPTYQRYRGRQVWFVRVYLDASSPFVPAPTLTPPFTTLAIIDGRIMSTAVLDGYITSTATDDGRRGTT